MSGKATATKSSKEKWLRRVQSVREKGENGIGGSSTITASLFYLEIYSGFCYVKVVNKVE